MKYFIALTLTVILCSNAMGQQKWKSFYIDTCGHYSLSPYATIGSTSGIITFFDQRRNLEFVYSQRDTAFLELHVPIKTAFIDMTRLLLKSIDENAKWQARYLRYIGEGEPIKK